jgi:hypothetical protein
MSSSEQPDLEMVDGIFLIKFRDYQSFHHARLCLFAIASVVLALVCLFAEFPIVEQEQPYRIL